MADERSGEEGRRMEAQPVNQSPGDWAGVRRALRAVRTRARGVLVARAMFNLVASLTGAAVMLVLADFLLRLPREIRFFHLFVALGWVVYWTRRAIIPGARFRPPLTEIALRVEHAPGASASLAGHLASGLADGQFSRVGRLPQCREFPSYTLRRDA